MKIKCPCNDCNNRYGTTQVEVIGDLVWKGMTNDYTRWHLHGEGNSDEDKEDTMYLMQNLYIREYLKNPRLNID